MQGYLNKASAYKRGNLAYLDQGIVEDNFSTLSEGFAGNGYGNFTSLCASGAYTFDVLTGLSLNTYKWSYVCGPGTDTSIAGFGSITDLHQTTYQGIFSMLFGSYFGDWNTSDNLMRSAMANGKLLTTAWAGRPNWFFHHMGMNNPIGYSTQLSIENSSKTGAPMYDTEGMYGNGIHMALLGDPTLRSEYLPVVNDLVAYENTAGTQVDLFWSLPVADITAIQVYKYNLDADEYLLEANLTGLDTTYTDDAGVTGDKYYISYTQLENTITGSYFNNATGSFTEALPLSNLPVMLTHFSGYISNDNGLLEWATAQEINFSHFELEKKEPNNTWETIAKVEGNHNTSEISYYSAWDTNLSFGPNTYRLKMVDYDDRKEYSTYVSLYHNAADARLKVYPNPSLMGSSVTLISKKQLKASDLKIVDLQGKSYEFKLEGNTLIQNLVPGEYIIQFNGESVKWIIM